MRFCQSMMYADPAQWVELARHAEALGFDQLALSDHVFYPEKLTSSYPYSPNGRPVFEPDTPWPDVWVMVGAMAAVTRQIEFTTNVYVLPARNPFVVAKAVGTAAWLSGDRVSLGVGAGWMREEFDCLEQPFERRGARLEEQIAVLRALWQGGMVEHHGEFYDFDRLQTAPVPDRPVPVLIGGHSERALQRAARIGDGWVGVQYARAELWPYLERLRELRAEHGTEGRPFEVVAAINDALPTPDVCAELVEMGVDTLITSAWLIQGKVNATLGENKHALDAFAERFIAPLRA
ncbi:MAG: TIGR03619 family F420-dependent LLM class oxidoreductase [Acidimicrobiales bacterium]